MISRALKGSESRTFRSQHKCPKLGKPFVAVRQRKSEGKTVLTYCPPCGKLHYFYVWPND